MLEIEYSSLASSVGPASDTLCLDDVMDCFKNLRGLKRVEIVGDFDKTYCLVLTAAMKLLKTILENAGSEEDL